MPSRTSRSDTSTQATWGIQDDEDTGLLSATPDNVALLAGGVQALNASVLGTQVTNLAANNLRLNSLSAGAANSSHEYLAVKTGIGTSATPFAEIVIPNGLHAAMIRIDTMAILGGTDNYEAVAIGSYLVGVSRVTGANAAVIARACGLIQPDAIAPTAGLPRFFAQSGDVTFSGFVIDVGTVTGGPTATQTAPVRCSITPSGGTNNANTLLFTIRLVNSQGSGIVVNPI